MGCWRTWIITGKFNKFQLRLYLSRIQQKQGKFRVAAERTRLLGICSISSLRYQLKFTHKYSLVSASKDFNQHAKLSKSARDRDWAIAVFLLTQIFCSFPWPHAYFSVLPLLLLSFLFSNLPPPNWTPQHANAVRLLPATAIKITLEIGELKERSCSLI